MPFDEEKLIQSLVELYRQGFLNVLKVLLQKEAKKARTTWYYKQHLKQIMEILNQLDRDAAQWIQENIPKIYQQNYTQVLAYINKIGMQRDINPSFAQIHQRAIDVIAQNMFDNLRSATNYAGRRINDYYRRAALEAEAEKFTVGQTWQEMAKNLEQKLLSKGLTGFKDRLGREWRLDSYAEMVARTTTREIATAATINACKEFDIDLVQITKHYPTCELCAPLQGKVFSLSGKDKRYPKYDGDLVRIPKHPNCRHVLVPYVRELDPDADETQKYSNTSLTEDPRSEKEKQAYKEMRDKVTIQTTRRRAREILLSDKVSLEEKVKAAEKLKKSYDSTGQIPRGIDASILKQYDDFIKSQNNGIINAEKVIQEAKNGGRHSGKYKDASNWTNGQLQKAINSYEKQVKLHEDKINNPAKYVADWETLDERKKQGLLKKWRKDANRNAELKVIMEHILKERGGLNE